MTHLSMEMCESWVICPQTLLTVLYLTVPLTNHFTMLNILPLEVSLSGTTHLPFLLVILFAMVALLMTWLLLIYVVNSSLVMMPVTLILMRLTTPVVLSSLKMVTYLHTNTNLRTRTLVNTCWEEHPLLMPVTLCLTM